MSATTSAPNQDRTERFAWLALALQMLAVAGVLWKAGRLAPVAMGDTPSYVDFPWQSLTAVLGGPRTPGYPLFLQLAKLIEGQHAAAPAMQMLAYFGCVAIMFRQLCRCTGATIPSLAAASALLYANILHGYVNTIATDTLAAGVGIAAAALAIGAAAKPHAAHFLLLSLAVTLGWLIRPAYLFLIILCPLLAGLACPLVLRPTATRIKRVLTTSVCCLCPLLLYCGLRWAVVGQFGIVSFGGYNLIGIAGQFLEAADLPHLPEDLRPLAEQALKHRQEASPRGDFGSEPKLHYLRMENEYDRIIWDDFEPIARANSATTPANVQLRRLGTAILWRHPGEYAVWLLKAVRQAAKKLAWDLLDNPIYLLVSGLICGMIPISFGFPVRSTGDASGLVRVWKLSWLLAVTYAILNLSLVILVCPPLGRFTDAAAVLLGMPLFTTAMMIRRDRWPFTRVADHVSRL